MIASTTREFMAMVAIAQHFGRPSTPTHQAWIESLNKTIKYDYPHLMAITDPTGRRAELDVVQVDYNSCRVDYNSCGGPSLDTLGSCTTSVLAARSRPCQHGVKW